MKVLVTGGGGFLGGEIVRQLLGEGRRVRSFSRSRYEALSEAGVEETSGDLSDCEAVADACAGCDIVFHVAARAGVGGRYDDFYQANVVGTHNVIQGCRRAAVPRLVYTSSPSVVFDGSDMEGADETAPYPDRYRAHYPRTKAEAERAVLASNEPGLLTVSLRPHLIWGPGDTHIVPGLIERARQGRLRRVGDGSNRVDFTYVEDAARAHLLAAQALKSSSTPPAGRAYFITQAEPILMWEFVNQLLAAAGLGPVERSVSARMAYVAGWLCEGVYRALSLSGEPPITRFLAEEMATAHWFDVSAARRDFGYQPRVPVDEGLRRLAEWFATGDLR